MWQLRAGSEEFASRLLEIVLSHPQDLKVVFKTLRTESTNSAGTTPPDEQYMRRQIAYMKFDELVPADTYPSVEPKRRRG